MTELSRPREIGPAEVVASTSTGKVVGRRLSDGKYQFLGIPYAASPNRPELRFRRPVAHEGWTGYRDATSHGPSAPQPVVDYWGRPGDDPSAAWGNGGNWYALFAPTHRPGDDYLTVNITTPGARAEGLPVLVFIHGGAFSLGNNSMTVYDGAKMADLDVVFVALNYRLGAEGFWHIEGGDSNVGLRDQIFALEWIQENIASFGGDPGNVTLIGQSAGANSIGLLSVSPLAKNLFHRSIAHSSGVAGAMPTLDAIEDAARVGQAIGLEPSVLAARDVAPMDLVERIHRATLRPVRPCPHGRMDYATIFVPKIDDDVVLSTFRQDFAQVRDQRPMITGITADESAWRVYQTGAHDFWTERHLLDYLDTLVADPVAALAAIRQVHDGLSPAQLKARVMYYDMYLRNIVPALDSRAAHSDTTFCYLFDQKSKAGAGHYGAFHLIDLPYLFDMLDDPSAISMMGGRGSQKTANAMRSAWRTFIHEGTVEWPSYDPAADTIAVFRDGVSGLARDYGDRDLLKRWTSLRI